MDRLAFFEKLYRQELSRRTAFSTQLSAPTAAIGAVSAALCYLLAHFRYGGAIYPFSGAVELAFQILSGISAFMIASSAYRLWLVARGFGYEYMPDPLEQQIFLRQLEDCNKAEGIEDARGEAEEEFAAYLTSKFRKCASMNWRANNYQSGLLYQGITAAGLSLAFLVIALVCYYIDVRFDPAP